VPENFQQIITSHIVTPVEHLNNSSDIDLKSELIAMNAVVQSVCVSLQVSTECPAGSRCRKHRHQDHSTCYIGGQSP